MQVVRDVSSAAANARASGKSVPNAVNVWTLAATFSTLTNVNFSDERIAEYLKEGNEYVKQLGGTNLHITTNNNKNNQDLSSMSLDQLEDYGATVSVPKRQAAMGDDDAFCLNELATYGLKGVCAYSMHIHQLLESPNNTSVDKNALDEIVKDIHELFDKTNSAEADTQGLLAACMRVGQVNTKVLALLDEAHAACFGIPCPTQVRTTAVEGKCILISGHDMEDLYHLLKATEGTGINVYTHGEMLPAHMYPALKSFPHLRGNIGTAWQNQTFEFAAFPGPVIMTTNCIVPPRRKYQSRLFTMNEVGVDGVTHIQNRDYSQVIASALAEKGFPRTIEPPHFVTTGFNHRVVLPLAEKILGAVSEGALSRIFLIGGCDGSQWDRSYFTTLAEETPDDSIILTLGCAKNRIIHSKKLDGAMLGDTGLPRVLDMGQCNDSYSAVVVALELAKALNCTVNDLPLSLAVSHLEQKAAAVLLTLLSLGVKNIRLGPSLPAYITPNILEILSKEFNLMKTEDAHEDLKMMMQGK
jgi:hydroxylamine reductase